jgi:hypothetical protein
MVSRAAYWNHIWKIKSRRHSVGFDLLWSSIFQLSQEFEETMFMKNLEWRLLFYQLTTFLSRHRMNGRKLGWLWRLTIVSRLPHHILGSMCAGDCLNLSHGNRVIQRAAYVCDNIGSGDNVYSVVGWHRSPGEIYPWHCSYALLKIPL